ncbi:hypothetical protein, partial [Nocardia sp. NPDC004722]
MTTEDSIAAEPETVTVVAGRRRWWPWLSGLIVVALAVAAVTVWLVSRPQEPSAAAAARETLRAAQLALINAPGEHYTGTVTGKSGKTEALDLRVTNTGDLSGTLDYGQGKTLSYLMIGGKTFLRGGRDAWVADGFGPEDAERSEGQWILEPAARPDVDVAQGLQPGLLGYRLDPDAAQGIPVSRGSAAMIDGRYTEGITSGGVTTFAVAGRAARVTDANFDVTLAPMSADEVAEFYRDLRSTVVALDDASDTETQVTSVGSWSTPCGPACTAISTLTSSPHPFVTVTVPSSTPPVNDIVVSYRMVLTIGGVTIPRPDCSGVLPMPGNGTVTVSCAFTVGPGNQVRASLTTRPILG